MADDFGFQPLEQKEDFGFQPIPKIPDTSGVQNVARKNLSANDNAEEKKILTPQQRLDMAVGAPVGSLLNREDQTPIPSDIRRQYTKAIARGDAHDFGDFMQTTLHSVLPIAAGVMHPIDRAKKIGEDVVGAFAEMGKGGATLLAYPFISEENKNELLKNSQLSDFSNPEAGTPREYIKRGIELEQATVGRAMGALYSAPAAVLSPLISPAIEATPDIAKKAGVSNEWAEMIPGGIGVGMDMLGMAGIKHGAGQLKTLRETRERGSQFPAGAGPWDNLPGRDAIVETVAKHSEKQADQVTSSDINNVIAQGTKGKAPLPQDFKAVETVTDGAFKEDTLHIIYNETGIRPDQVFEDARADPQIAKDVAIGKVPDAYEHMVEPREIPAEKLAVETDKEGRAFRVVDADGDYVRGGFDSAQEARQYIEDKRFEAEERAAIEEEGRASEKPSVEKTSAGEQQVIPGAEKITEKALAERKMAERMKAEKAQEPADEGLFDVAGRSQGDIFDTPVEKPVEEKVAAPTPKPKLSVIQPSKVGKPTSLRTFLRNDGAKFDENGNLISMKDENGKVNEFDLGKDRATELAHEYGYTAERLSIPDLENLVKETPEHTRAQDADRAAKAYESEQAKKWKDPSFVEHEAHNAGIDTEPVKGETEHQRITRIVKEITEFYKNQEGSASVDIYRRIVGESIIAAEKFAGKFTGNFFQKLGEGYIKTFQPELMGDKALRADAFMAKYKTALQEAENSYFKQSMAEIRKWDKMPDDARMQWLYDHETGRWNEIDNPEHARFQALLDSAYKAEQANGATDMGYKENYLPHAWEKPEEVKKYFASEAYIKKYGRDGFTKRSTFQLIQDGVRAGFKLKTNNPERMLVARLLAGDNMVRTMNLLHDLESSGIATKVSTFSVDKRIAKTEAEITEVQKKYQEAFEKKNPAKQSVVEGTPPASSKTIETYRERLSKLQERLDEFRKEKEGNKLTPEQMASLKDGFRIIGPDNKAWVLDQQLGPLWKNAMDMKGLWENQGATGDAYRLYMKGKATWVALKLAVSLFHPMHMVGIHTSAGFSTGVDHLLQGGKFSDLSTGNTSLKLGFGKEGIGLTHTHPAIDAWNTPADSRTPKQREMVNRMIEGGLKPTISAQEALHFRDNLDKAIAGVGVNNLRLIGVATQLPGMLSAPAFNHWIPALKADSYFYRTDLALKRDPSLLTDAGRRGEVFRQIAKDTERNYGEMNQDTLFWNKVVKDAFNASMLSGGWKLAMLQNFRGLAEPLKIAYDFAKTGEFSKDAITHQVIQSYAYTATMLMQGALLTYLMTGSWELASQAISWAMPNTGDKNPDGSEIRLNQPAFIKEFFMINRDLNEEGLFGGTSKFLYHQTLIPGIVDTLNNQDFVGRPIISDPTNLDQWASTGWDSIMPITITSMEKADQKNSETAKTMNYLGFPIAGAYINQTKFEQKVLHAYSKANPPTTDAYTAKLKSNLKSAIADKDYDEQKNIEGKMRENGMTSQEIEKAKKTYDKKFVDVAWGKLSAKEQKHLIEYATEEEKRKFTVKTK